MNNPEVKPFTIAIVGGGLGGLALAVGLLKNNVPFHIYESASVFSEIGAGIAFGPNSLRALELIDKRMLEGYNRHAAFNEDPERASSFFTVRLGTNLKAGEKEIPRKKLLNDLIWYLDDNETVGTSTNTKTRSCIHRARLLEELVSLIPLETVSFNKTLESLEEISNNSVRLHFNDGTSAVASAVVGCDGIKSKTRETICGKLDPKFVGEYAYRAMIPRAIFRDALGEEQTGNGHLYCGYGGYVIHYPVEKGEYINIVAVVRKPDLIWDARLWQISATKEEMVEDLKGWHPTILDMLSLNPNIQKWALFHLPHSKPYYKNRMCLLGDSAHATTPHLGAGAGMAMEDAYILSSLLGKAKSNVDLEKAFKAYDAIRRPRTQMMIQKSACVGTIYAFENEDIGDDLEKLKTQVETEFAWVWHEDLAEELADAMDMMLQKI